MNTGNRLLTALLLILTGIMIGALFILFEQRIMIDDRASVEVTEVKRSDRPIFTDEMLQNMDSRFLFKTVAEEIAPTVVYIETQVQVDERERGFRGGEDGEEERGFWDRMLPERVRTVGSGVIISPDGYILTNNHVIEGAVENTIQVVLNDKRSYSARVVGTDPTTDIAVLKIDMNNLPVITLGNSDSLSVGEWVLAFGNPFQLRSTVTAGIVSALSREVNIIDEEMRIQSFIQTDAAINRGNSGGALVNTSGELIGVNTAIASENGNYQGYGFAVPSNLAGKVARDLIEYGEVRRAMMGVSIAGVNATRADDLGMDRIRGVEILMVSPDGAADQAGLRASDVILSVNGTEVSESNELQEKIAVLPPGEVVNLSIWREGTVIEQQVELELLDNDQPVFASSEPEGDRQQPGSIEFETFRELGFRVMKFTNSEGEPADLIISSVREDSHAEEQGLREGYRIRQVEGEDVEELTVLREQIVRHLAEKGSVTLEIETRDGERSTHELEQQ